VQPNAGYYISSISGCNGTTFTGSSSNITARSYTTGAITASCTVTATFTSTAPTYTVTLNAGTGGNIYTGSQTGGSVTVSSGQSMSIAVKWNSGYQLVSVTGCNVSFVGSTYYNYVPFQNVYNTGPITQNCTITATFVKQ
jgi:hypothetical protein